MADSERQEKRKVIQQRQVLEQRRVTTTDEYIVTNDVHFDNSIALCYKDMGSLTGGSQILSERRT